MSFYDDYKRIGLHGYPPISDPNHRWLCTGLCHWQYYWGLHMWAKHPAPYPPCGGRFPSTRPQTVLTCLHVYGFPLVTLLFTIVLNHRVAVLTDNQCLAMSFEHQFLPLIIAFQLGESPHMMHDYFSFLTT